MDELEHAIETIAEHAAPSAHDAAVVEAAESRAEALAEEHAEHLAEAVGDELEEHARWTRIESHLQEHRSMLSAIQAEQAEIRGLLHSSLTTAPAQVEAAAAVEEAEVEAVAAEAVAELAEVVQEPPAEASAPRTSPKQSGKVHRLLNKRR